MLYDRKLDMKERTEIKYRRGKEKYKDDIN